jgi:hypothetical protein
LSEQYAVFTDSEEDENEPRCCVSVEELPAMRGHPEEEPQLTLAIHGPDQDATEFLTRPQFEELVSNARRIMGW